MIYRRLVTSANYSLDFNFLKGKSFMRKLLVLLMFLLPLRVLALDAGNFNLNAGLGLFGTRGVLGVSGDYFLTQHQAVDVAVGADFIGGVTSAGYRVFSDKINNSATFWDRCFFFIDCDEHAYGGLSVQYAGSGRTTFTDSQGTRVYDSDSKFLGVAVLGMRSIFKNKVTFDAEISYRSIITGGRITQVSGPEVASDVKNFEAGYRTFGIGIAVGYLF